jgi:hypothetical protein
MGRDSELLPDGGNQRLQMNILEVSDAGVKVKFSGGELPL